jgi:hypothetical protein
MEGLACTGKFFIAWLRNSGDIRSVGNRDTGETGEVGKGNLEMCAVAL